MGSYGQNVSKFDKKNLLQIEKTWSPMYSHEYKFFIKKVWWKNFYLEQVKWVLICNLMLKEGQCTLFFCHSHSHSHSHNDIGNVYLLFHLKQQDKHCIRHYDCDYDCDKKKRYKYGPWAQKPRKKQNNKISAEFKTSTMKILGKTAWSHLTTPLLKALSF